MSILSQPGGIAGTSTVGQPAAHATVFPEGVVGAARCGGVRAWRPALVSAPASVDGGMRIGGVGLLHASGVLVGAVAPATCVGGVSLLPGPVVSCLASIPATSGIGGALLFGSDGVSVMPGSKVVVGPGQFVAAGVVTGWCIAFSDFPDRRYPIASVEDARLTLAMPWIGSQPAVLGYVVTPGGWPLMAPVPWVRTGVIDMVTGSADVGGVGTGWAGVVEGGDVLVIDDHLYEIASVGGDGALTLATPYQGETLSGMSYGIIRLVNNTSAAALSYRLAQVLRAFGVRDAEFRAWVSGIPGGGPARDGRYPLTGSDGVARQVPCPALWQGGGIGGGGSGVEVSLDGTIVTAASRATLDFRGAVRVDDDPLYQRARVTVDVRSEAVEYLPAPDTGDLSDAVCRSQSLALAGGLAIDGADASGGAVTWKGAAYRLTLSGAGQTGVSFEIAGVDHDGSAANEMLTGPDGVVVGGTWWRAVTRVSTTGPVTSPVSVGRAGGPKIVVDGAVSGVISAALPDQDMVVRLVGPPSSGWSRDVVLHLHQPATARAVTWDVPAGWSLVWPQTGVPPRPGDGGQRTVWRFRWLDEGGTRTIVGSQDVAPLGVGNLGAASGSTITIDAAVYPVYVISLPDNDCTINLTGAPSMEYRRELLLTMRQPATARAVIFSVEPGWDLLWDNSPYQPGVGGANRRTIWKFMWVSSMMTVIGSRVAIEWNGLPQPSPPTVIFDNDNKAPQYVSVSSDGLSVALGQSTNNYHYGIRLSSPATTKSYCEFKITNSGGGRAVGLARSLWDFEGVTTSSVGLGRTNHTWGYHHTGDVKYNGTVIATSSSYAYNDVAMIAFDPNGGSNGKLWFGKNGIWIGDPGAGTGPCFSDISGTLGTLFFAVTGSGAKTTALQADPSRWLFVPPAGFGPVQ